MNQDIPKIPKPEIVTETLKSQGPKLPLGTVGNGGQYFKDIEVRPWRFPEEREIGRLRAENKGMNVAQLVNLTLSVMNKKLASFDFESMPLPERRAVISMMTMPDVLYAYAWLRRESVGSEVKFDPRCPGCGHDFVFVADLDSMDVKSVSDLKSALWDYEFKTPIMIRGKEVKKLTLGPAKWNAVEALGNTGISELDVGATKSGIIFGSIHSVDGLGEIPLAEHELDDMVKYDIERLSVLIDEKAIGPDLSLEGVCPRQRCGRKFRMPIPWATDDFFAVSSP